jgi:hypothetical protein
VKTGEELAIAAMRKEYVKLCKVADKAKAECDECVSIGTEAIAIHNEFAAIVAAKETGQHVVDKLEALQKRQKRVNRIVDKSIIDLCDKQHKAECERDRLLGQIRDLEFRVSVRGKHGG